MTEVVIESNEHLPEVLYKYRSWENPYHKRLLTDNEIFFAKPSAFNDPFDCQICPSLNTSSAGAMRRAISKSSLQAYPEMPRRERDRCVTKRVLELRDPAEQSRIKKEWQQRIDEEVGIFSLTENQNSLVMWAHYANSHRGLCIGFRAECLKVVSTRLSKGDGLSRYLLRVRYVDDYPVIDLFDPKRIPGTSLIPVLATKAQDWSYEEEYRLMVTRPPGNRNYTLQNDDRRCVLGSETIVSVTMGCRMPP